MGDGNIVENDKEFLGSFRQIVSDFLRNLLSLSQKLLSVVLSNHTFQYFLSNRRNNSLIIIHTDFINDFRNLLFNWSKQNSESNFNLLQVSSSRSRLNLLILGPHFHYLRLLQNGNHKVHAFPIDLLLKSPHLIHFHGSFSSVYCEDKSSEEKPCAYHNTSELS